MTAKQYLQQAYRADKLIKHKMAELRSLRDLVLSMSAPTLCDFRRGSSDITPIFAKRIEKIEELEKELNEGIDRYIDLRQEISEKIERIENLNERLVLHKRYLMHMTG